MPFVIRASVWVTLSFFVAVPSFSAVYMYVNGLVGESSAQNYAGWADIASVSHGLEGATALVRTPSFRDFTFVKEFDKMSTGLMEAASSGRVFSDVVFHHTATYGAGRVVMLEVILTNVRVSSYAYSASGNDEAGPPLEEVTLSFENIRFVYHEYDKTGQNKGKVEYTWKVEEGR